MQPVRLHRKKKVGKMEVLFIIWWFNGLGTQPRVRILCCY